MRFTPRGPLRKGTSPSFFDTNVLPGHIGFAWSGTVDTFTAWQELSAATEIDAVGFVLHSRQTAAGGTNTLPNHASSLVEVGIGAAGSEVAIYRFHSTGNFTRPADQRFIPLELTRGTRLAVRVSRGNTATGSTANRFGFQLIPRSPWFPRGFLGVEHIGVNAGAAARLASPFTIADGAGGLHEVSAGIAQHWRAFMFGIGTNNQANATAESLERVRWRLVAGPSSGTVVAGDFLNGASLRGAFPPMGPFPCDLPAGTRLQLHLTTSVSTRNQCAPQLWGFY